MSTFARGKVSVRSVRRAVDPGRSTIISPVLGGLRSCRSADWCLLKREENLTDKQAVTLKELLSYNLKTVRAWLMKDDFQHFWEYHSAGWAGRFLDEWVTRALRSRLEPM